MSQKFLVPSDGRGFWVGKLDVDTSYSAPLSFTFRLAHTSQGLTSTYLSSLVSFGVAPDAARRLEPDERVIFVRRRWLDRSFVTG